MGVKPEPTTSGREVWHGVLQILAPIFVPRLLATYLAPVCLAIEKSQDSCDRELTGFTQTNLWLEESTTMNTTAIPLSRLSLASRPSLADRLHHFVTLMKPRVMALALFTAFVGLMVAP